MGGSRLRALRDERGAAMLFTALALPVVVAFAALGVGATGLYTAKQDAQRAVDLGALAAAAAMPTVDVGALSDANVSVTLGPVAVGVNADLSWVTTPLLDGDDWRQRACAVVADQLGGGRSQVTNAFLDGDATCEATWSWDTDLLEHVVGCVDEVLEVDIMDCFDALSADLSEVVLPAWETVEGLVDSIPVVADLVGPVLPDDPILLTQELLANAESALQETLDGLLDLLTGVTCRLLHIGCPDGEIAEVLGQLEALDLLGDSLSVRHLVGGLAPGLLTPRVEVRLSDLGVRPPLSPRAFPVSRTATARRVIKNVLAVPSLGIRDLLGWVVPEEVASVDISGPLVDTLDDLGPLLDGAIAGVLGLACGLEPVSGACRATMPLLRDVRDALRFPPGGEAPTLVEFCDGLVGDCGVTWVVSALRTETLPETLLDVLGSPSMLLPALDIVPVVVERLSDGSFSLTEIVDPLLQTTGLYGARLVG